MQVNKLNKAYIEDKIDEFIGILSGIPNEYWQSEHFLYELKDKWKYSIVLEDQGKIIGYIIASNKIHSIHIHKFMVERNYRSKGIGLLLLEQFENNCQQNNVEVITLKVDRNNERAIKFYLKNRFEINNDNAELFTMSKNL